MIRTSGQMWNADGDQQDTLAVIPDSCYAGIYQVVIDDCRANGAFDPATMGSVPNVGLMAQKAEEYGSHDKTFEIPTAGTVRVVDDAGDVRARARGRAPATSGACARPRTCPIRDWVKLAVTRARATGAPAVFWLDEDRAHDAQLIAKVRAYLADHDTDGLQIEILAPGRRHRASRSSASAGARTPSRSPATCCATTSPTCSRSWSSAPAPRCCRSCRCMNGGGLFETGAGGSAPKHVQQFVKENHLRWDCLGEFLALAASLRAPRHKPPATSGPRCWPTRSTAPPATLLDENKSPARHVGQIDNRGSHSYLALYWAQELAAQSVDTEVAELFAPVAKALTESEAKIAQEMLDVQGSPVDLGGYYSPDEAKATAVMRPSATLNAVIDRLRERLTAELGDGRRCGPEPELAVDLPRGPGEVEGVEVQARRAPVEQGLAQLGGDLDADLPHLIGIVDAVEAGDHLGRHFAPRQFGHACDRVEVGDRHDPGDHRLVDAQGGQLVDHAQVVVEAEEELRDAEVGQLSFSASWRRSSSRWRSGDGPRGGRRHRWRTRRWRGPARPARPRTAARRSPSSSAGGGSPPRARRFSTPARRSSTRISASSSRLCTTHVRWAIGLSVVVRSMPATRSRVRSRDHRPPR